ncbi:hypothetical protein C4571_03320 [Candidatus Parcubacteria bacterium]|nr:MAG: hypothetical protein C4571_03320 [Candidatus Parcubacteria bacterium]
MRIINGPALLFLSILIFSTFFALSVHVLNVGFCAQSLNHGGKLCDVVEQLSKHNFFATAIAVIISIFGAALFAVSRENNETDFLVSARIRRESFRAPSPLLREWLRLRYNSPNI